MVSRKAGSSDNDKQSAIVRDFLKQTQSSSSSSQQPPPASTVISSSGFVPTSAQTEQQKKEQREWDRAELLKVDDDDAQVKIYNAYSANANTSAEGVNTRRGLGAASEGAVAAAGGRGRMMSFVSAGGAPASTPASTGVSTDRAAAAGSPASASGSFHGATSPALPSGWTMGVDPASGAPYYCNVALQITQWHPPPPDPPALPVGWIVSTDPTTGKYYYCNPATGESSWTAPTPPPPPPPTPPPALPPPTFHAPPPSSHAGAASAHYSQPEFAVRVRGLPPSMAEADVRDVFASCGRIVRCTIDRSAYSAGSSPKGATVCFDASASADLAVKQMNGTKMRNFTLQVDLVGNGGGTSAGGRPKPY